MAQVSARMAAALARQGPKAAQLTKQVLILTSVSCHRANNVTEAAITGHLVSIFQHAFEFKKNIQMIKS